MMIGIHDRIEPVQLFNYMQPNLSTSIVGGEFSGILNWNKVAFPSMYKLYQVLLSNFWKPADVNMQSDIPQWDSLLTPAEREAFKRANVALAMLDSIQTPTMLEVVRVLSDSTFASLFAVVSQQEAVHTESYAYIFSSLIPTHEQEEAFDEVKKDPIILKRTKQIVDAYDKFRDNPTVQNLFELFVHSVILEGLFFYAGFAFFYFLASRQKMLGTSTMISYIQKDEMQHTYLTTQTVRILMEQFPDLNNEANIQYIKDSIASAVDSEKEWAAELLKDIDGLEIDEFNAYIEYLANKRFRQLGLANQYPDLDNVMPWIQVFDDSMIDNTKTDQFEQVPRAYTKVSSDNGFDEL